MNIAVIGTGYVGLVTGVCLSWLGFNVMCMDIDKEKISKLNNGIVQIYEPGLEEILKECVKAGRLFFTDNMKKAIDFGEVIFIAVGTPSDENDSADLKYVFQAASEIANCMDEYKVIVNKSTVPVGTGSKVKDKVKEVLVQLGKSIDFDIVSNPEFLREGSAIKDFIKLDRIVIGVETERSEYLMKRIYSKQIFLDIPVIVTNIETAEMIKYASNAFLATKISYINEIANICDLCNADITIVARAMGLDKRINPSFLSPGPGYGGSCFPKDTKALIGFGRSMGYSPRIIEGVVDVNNTQRVIMFNKIRNALGDLNGKVITILGISFKPGTDDIREAPSISIIKLLLEEGAKVLVYDPIAMDNTRLQFPEFDVVYCDDLYSACTDSDCVVLVTEWKEFCELDFVRLKSIMKTSIFIDLRNVYDPTYVKNFGFYYRGVGKK
jgi:UDPglucose 6-dehydrogenase